MCNCMCDVNKKERIFILPYPVVLINSCIDPRLNYNAEQHNERPCELIVVMRSTFQVMQ